MRGKIPLYFVTASAILLAGCKQVPDPVAQTPTQSVKPAQATATPKKGPGRVAVEHGLDADAAKVNPEPQVTTVENLLATRDKGTSTIDLSQYKTRRVPPFELTTFEITGTIKNIKHEKDGDYYFVLQGKSGAQAVIEVPDPTLCNGSPLLPKIEQARQELEKKYHPTDQPRELNETVTVDGVGFLGSRRKPGSGSFGNSVRLMPGTDIKFDP